MALTCWVRACLDEHLKAILLVLLLWNLALMATLVAPKPQPPSCFLASLFLTTRHRLIEAGVSLLRVAESGPGRHWLKGTAVAGRVVVTASRSLESAQHSLAHSRGFRPLPRMAWATCHMAIHSLSRQQSRRDTATCCSMARSSSSTVLLFSWWKLDGLQ